MPGAVRVQLLRVRGGNCVEGQTWYQDRNAIHVRNGCRAVFRIDANNGYGVGGWDNGWNGGGWNDGGVGTQAQRIRCESWNYRDQICRVAGQISTARITRVIAGDCRDGATWRWDRNSIHVRNGCRADFEVLIGADGWIGGSNRPGNRPGIGGGGGFGGGNRPGMGGGRPVTTINCESWNYQQARCAIPAGRQVQLVQVRGGNCQQGRTWGWQAGSIWVNGGCRASFNVY